MGKNKRYRWTAALARLPKNKKLKIAEIGVWCGHFSEQILKRRPLAKIIQVDRWKIYTDTEKQVESEARMSRYWQEIFDNAKAENMQRIKIYMNRVKIIESDSVIAAKKVKNKSLDLVFIDAAHSYAGCRADILAWLPKTKTGGWICGHDYPRRPGVRQAVDEIFGNRVIKDSDSTWFVRVT